MTNEVNSPLRRRVIEDKTIRKFGPKTRHERRAARLPDPSLRRRRNRQ
jgi:hypothetical protein